MIHQVLIRLPCRVARTSFSRHVGRCQAYATNTAPPASVQWYEKVRVSSRRQSNRDTYVSELKLENSMLTIRDGDKRVPIPGRWLRDNCSCSECRNAETAQRQVNVLKNPEAGRVVGVRRLQKGEAFEVIFADGHHSTITKRFLFDRGHRDHAKWRAGYTEPRLWQSSIDDKPPTVEYETVRKEDGMATLLAKVRQYGFCFVDNMPPTPEETRALLEQIGPIRNTHYGGFYDFTSDLSSKDTAYTSESLEPHTDTTYFTDPIGLQALHLLSHTDGEGGLSSLVDGFAAAAHLHNVNPDAYHTLSRTKVFAHASGNEGVNIQPAGGFPVLNHLANRGADYLHQVRWNTADRAGVGLPLGPFMESWYDAAAEFDALLSSPEYQYWFQLKPGKMLLFDNWRVLHGRSAFTGKRRMCGGYINRDDFISKYRMTNLTKEEIAASTVTG